MSTDNKIRDEKLQYDINREAVKISALSSGKIDVNFLQLRKYNLIFAYSSLRKAHEKQ